MKTRRTLRYVVSRPSTWIQTNLCQRKQSRSKRRKGNTGKPIASRVTRATASLSDLLDAFQFGIQIEPSSDDIHQKDGRPFESVIEDLLPEYTQARHNTWVQTCDTGESVCTTLHASDNEFTVMICRGRSFARRRATKQLRY